MSIPTLFALTFLLFHQHISSWKITAGLCLHRFALSKFRPNIALRRALLGPGMSGCAVGGTEVCFASLAWPHAMLAGPVNLSACGGQARLAISTAAPRQRYVAESGFCGGIFSGGPVPIEPRPSHGRSVSPYPSAPSGRCRLPGLAWRGGVSRGTRGACPSPAITPGASVRESPPRRAAPAGGAGGRPGSPRGPRGRAGRAGGTLGPGLPP